jgi:hypothetical protein
MFYDNLLVVRQDNCTCYHEGQEDHEENPLRNLFTDHFRQNSISPKVRNSTFRSRHYVRAVLKHLQMQKPVAGLQKSGEYINKNTKSVKRGYG